MSVQHRLARDDDVAVRSYEVIPDPSPCSATRGHAAADLVPVATVVGSCAEELADGHVAAADLSPTITATEIPSNGSASPATEVAPPNKMLP
ncbi:hypothetical protein E2562_022893 [Oryza meyeriana var. granulata]|uniref:Uncharacterized protein n=1 Tax=Oryza meyeriana var. granulata TaxID=110450 RepID=A0A6G1D5C0_9ORYZ|nr:hypothetical protein E2562_022893 [Oryza meyeriana var. granulata]